MSLSAAGNILVPAYLVLQSKGYCVTRKERDNMEVWIAESNGLRFEADSTIELLGVVSVYEARGESWRASDNEIYAFAKQFYPEPG